MRQVPTERWNATAWADAEASGRAANRRGGFLDDVTGFDAEHFGIPPAEARQMDPQQRIALEVACAAVEDARRSTASLAGTRTGVFMGAMWQEYPLFTQGAAEAIHAHSAIGWDNSVIPSRIAYALGLRGPAMAVATASSSSLVAVHLAVQSLRSGESDFALAAWRQPDAAPEHLGGHDETRHAEPCRPVPGLRRRRRRLRAGRGLRRSRAAPAVRRARRRRPRLRAGARQRGQQRRRDRRTDRPRPRGADGGAALGVGERRLSRRVRWRTSRRTARARRWAT